MGAGKSNPSTCWIMNVDQYVNLLTLLLLSGPLLIFGCVHACILVNSVNKMLQWMPNSQLRVSLERQLMDCRSSLLVLISSLFLSVLLLMVIPLVHEGDNSNYINTSWPVWFCFYMGIRSVFTFIGHVNWKELNDAFTCSSFCCSGGRVSRKNRISEGVFQLEEEDDEEERGERGRLVKIESSSSILVAQAAQQELLQGLVSDDWKINFQSLKLGRKIAAGACGQVYKGLYLNTPVAIKELFSPRYGDSCTTLEYIHLYMYI